MNLIDEQGIGAILANVELAFDQHGRVVHKRAAHLLERPGKQHRFHTAGHAFEHRVAHQPRAGARGLLLALGEHAADGDERVIHYSARAVRFHEVGNRIGQLFELGFEVIQRVAGKVQPRRFTFFGKDDLVAELRHVRQGDLHACPRFRRRIEVEERNLPCAARLFGRHGSIQRAFEHGEVLRAPAAHRVKAAGGDQAFQQPLVEAFHAIAEVEKARELAV
ncbi:hypothetical protein SDC9_158483 [bioreactor metagenome]|uniref:Uncharacterized protein n=1 Tax=bioreactor metagenome TaxID=1076179 RepID=A0A645FC76_9ZZZZ